MVTEDLNCTLSEGKGIVGSCGKGIILYVPDESPLPALINSTEAFVATNWPVRWRSRAQSLPLRGTSSNKLKAGFRALVRLHLNRNYLGNLDENRRKSRTSIARLLHCSRRWANKNSRWCAVAKRQSTETYNQATANKAAARKRASEMLNWSRLRPWMHFRCARSSCLLCATRWLSSAGIRATEKLALKYRETVLRQLIGSTMASNI